MKQVLLLSAILITITMTLFSCGSESRESLLTGKWQYDKKLNKDEMPEALPPNVVVTFNKDGTCISSKGEGHESKATYTLINNGGSLVTQEDKMDIKDTVKIISLTPDILQIETPHKDTIQFKKIS